MLRFSFVLLVICMASCIGTDAVDEPLGPVPSQIELSINSLSLLPGDTQQLMARVIASDGSSIDAPLSWNSTNSEVATVDNSGLVTALGAGQAWIAVSAQILIDSVLITVSQDPDGLASITLMGSTMNLDVGDMLQLTAELRSIGGDVITDRMISWQSSDTEVCEVDNTGLLTAIANGSAQIVANAEGISSLPYTIMVGGMEMTRTGMFQGLNGYNVSGTAALELNPAGNTLLFDTDFSSQNGPGLFVYLSPNANNVSGGVSLGNLKATSGAQSYDIPGSVNPADFEYVIVYCQPFGVPFGNAQLQ